MKTFSIEPIGVSRNSSKQVRKQFFRMQIIEARIRNALTATAVMLLTARVAIYHKTIEVLRRQPTAPGS
jgi:hypothetical protein